MSASETPSRRARSGLGAPSMGEVIRHLRRSQGFTQAAFAACAGLAPNALGALERGEVSNPRLSSVSRVAAALHISTPVLGVAFVLRVEEATLLAAFTNMRFRPVGSGEKVRGRHGPRTVAVTIKDLRGQAGLTQSALADLAGVGMYVGDLEQGRTNDPGLATMALLANALASRLGGQATVDIVLAKLICAFAGDALDDFMSVRELQVATFSKTSC